MGVNSNATAAFTDDVSIYVHVCIYMRIHTYIYMYRYTYIYIYTGVYGSELECNSSVH